MKTTTLLTLALVTLTTQAASAQPDPDAPPVPQLPAPAAAAPAPAPSPAPSLAGCTINCDANTSASAGTDQRVEKEGWSRPDIRLLHGIRIGGMFVRNLDSNNRADGDGNMTSLKDEFGIKTPYMMLLGYEAMYRIVGHSWLNVILVGNVSVAGLEQSKFIPAASGLIGAEFNQSFQIGIGVNLTPDEKSPSHMIVAAGWTPKVGSIYTPVHVFFVPDPGAKDEMGRSARNDRVGMTVGVNW